MHKNSLIIKSTVSFAFVYLLSAGIVFGALSLSGSGGGADLISPASPDSSTKSSASALNINPTAPKTEICPINGQKFTLTERQAWEKQRPALVMVENTIEARPQSGLSSADIVYEAVAEGGVTRFMGVFYCNAIANQGKVAPVRSARMHFVNLAAEYNTPVYVHVGGANCSAASAGGPCTSNKRVLALEELGKLGWRKAKGNDFDTILDIGVPILIRDYDRLGKGVQLATEHTMVGSLAQIWKEATKRRYADIMADGKTWLSGFRLWKFHSDPVTPSTVTTASQISFEFWKGYKDYAVAWSFDNTTGLYKRSQGGTPHVDLENQQQLSARNIIVQFVKEEGPLDEHKHMLYGVIGEGKAILFTGGTASEIRWKKSDQKSRTIYTDSANKEITLNPGQIWVEIVAIGSKIDYN